MSGQEQIDNLSDTAKAVAGAWFGMMSPGKGELTFELQKARPSDQAQEGLNELVRAKIVSVEAFNRYGGLVYRPIINCRWGFLWLHANRGNPAAKVQLTAPLHDQREAKAVQKAALAAQVPA